MYCRNCGKEIEDDSFCKYCGEPTQAGASRNDFSFSTLLMEIREKIRVFGHDKLISIFSWLAAAVSIVNRVKHKEIETILVGTAVDDYFVLSGDGRSLANAVLWAYILLCGLLLADVWKMKIWMGKGTYVILVISLLVQLAAMWLRIPAPY